MSVNEDKTCIDKPITVCVNLEVWPNGDIDFVIPGCKPIEFIDTPLKTRTLASTSANIKAQCHCADQQLHLYVLQYGSWIDVGHLGVPCNC